MPFKKKSPSFIKSNIYFLTNKNNLKFIFQSWTFFKAAGQFRFCSLFCVEALAQAAKRRKRIIYKRCCAFFLLYTLII